MLNKGNSGEIFSQLLDINWKIENKEYKSQEERNELNKQYHILNTNLVKEMGVENYMKFMSLGKEMFS
jgi:hypothetical protein